MRYQNVLETIGRTPVIRLNRLAPEGVNLWVKAEAFNPGGSVKDRMAAAIIEACEQNLADFKVPRAVYFLDEFPTAELGKISKKDLRELADSYEDA